MQIIINKIASVLQQCPFTNTTSENPLGCQKEGEHNDFYGENGSSLEVKSYLCIILICEYNSKYFLSCRQNLWCCNYRTLTAFLNVYFRTCDPPAPNNPLNNGTNMRFFLFMSISLKLLILTAFHIFIYISYFIYKEIFSFITLKNITSHIELNYSIMWNKFKLIYYYIFFHPHFSYKYIYIYCIL